MSQISIINEDETETHWVFSVSMQEHSCKVTLTDNFYRQLTNGEVPPEELVRESFEFLLEREPANNILSEFDLPIIKHYFPEYEEEIKKRLQA